MRLAISFDATLRSILSSVIGLQFERSNSVRLLSVPK